MVFEQVKFDVRGGFPFSLFEHHHVIKAEVRLPHFSVFIGTSCELMAACAGCLLAVMAGWTRRRLPLTQLLSSLARHTHQWGQSVCPELPRSSAITGALYAHFAGWPGAAHLLHAYQPLCKEPRCACKHLP